MFIVALGYAAAVIEIIMGVPQAWQSFRQRNDHEALRGISFGSQLLMFLHTLMWAIWAIATNSIPVLLAHGLAIPIYGMVCFYILRSRFTIGTPLFKTAPPLTED